MPSTLVDGFFIKYENIRINWLSFITFIFKEILFRKLLVHPLITEVRGKGLMLAAMTKNANITNEVILRCHKRGLILFWLLFEGTAIRITPPLTISNQEIEEGCQLLLEVMDEVHTLNL